VTNIRMKAIAALIGVTMMTMVGLTGCGSTDESESSGDLGTEYGSVLGEFQVTDIAGVTQNQSLVKDAKFTLVYIWATTCNPCIESLPKMEKLYEHYKDLGVNVVGIVVDLQDEQGTVLSSKVKDAKDISSTQGVTFENLDIPDSLLPLLQNEIQYTPTGFFVDSTGTVVGDLYVGVYDYDQWSDAIDQLLE
jgi:thiol-disulfide isomerase/thioredoxin